MKSIFQVWNLDLKKRSVFINFRSYTRDSHSLHFLVDDNLGENLKEYLKQLIKHLSFTYFQLSIFLKMNTNYKILNDNIDVWYVPVLVKRGTYILHTGIFPVKWNLAFSVPNHCALERVSEMTSLVSSWGLIVCVCPAVGLCHQLSLLLSAYLLSVPRAT